MCAALDKVVRCIHFLFVYHVRDTSHTSVFGSYRPVGSVIYRLGRASIAVAMVVVALSAGGSVAAASPTTVTWKVSSLTKGEVVKLSTLVSTNSPGVKTWSKSGSCTLRPSKKPTTLKMGATGSCALTLKIAKSGKYVAKTLRKTITLVTAVATTTTTTSTTVMPTTSTTVTPTTSTTVTPTTSTTVALACAQGGACTVGVDTGPGGGIVFYYSAVAFISAGSDCGSNCHYLEAATNTGSSPWTDVARTWATNVNSYNRTEVAGADGTAIGTGYQNTLDIVALTGNMAATSAAVEAHAYQGGGKTDWFLPSKEELNELCKYSRNQTTGITSEICTSGEIRSDFFPHFGMTYWSSSEASSIRSWAQDFMYGHQSYNFGGKTDLAFAVRPVRAF